MSRISRLDAENELRDDSWRDTPIIVSNNAAKDALNAEAVAALASATGQEWHWYHATDRRKGAVISDPSLIARLNTMHAGQTNQRLTRLPLVPGMRVIVTQNFDVDGGIVNGSIGILKQIRYVLRDDGKRCLTSCIVYIPDATAPQLPGLPPKHFPILPDTQDVTFEHPYSKRTMTISRTQLPLAPAYAMTAHKAQGQTFGHVIIDLQSCSGSEAPYVMLSRATSLNGVMILRPFKRSRISCNLSEDLRNSLRLYIPVLNYETMLEYGSTEEKREASSALQILREKIRLLQVRRQEQEARFQRAQVDQAARRISSGTVRSGTKRGIDTGELSQAKRRRIERN